MNIKPKCAKNLRIEENYASFPYRHYTCLPKNCFIHIGRYNLINALSDIINALFFILLSLRLTFAYSILIV